VAREEAECEEELEEHVCLCFITINQRRMVAHEITQGLPSLEATPPSQN
jgi:hypothetical protein